MTGAREMFYELSQTETDVEVVLGDDSAVRAVGRGTITFQRESMSPMVLRDVLYEVLSEPAKPAGLTGSQG